MVSCELDKGHILDINSVFLSGMNNTSFAAQGVGVLK